MDWSDEAKARLEEEEKRLRLKAANLQERHGAWSLMAKQELVVADDIRAALGEIGRRGLQYPDDLGISRDAAGLSARCAELRDRLVAQGKRAEAAEADRDEWRETAARRMLGRRAAEAELAEALASETALEAEVKRLRADLDLQNKEAERAFRGNQNRIGQLQDEVERLREALGRVLTEAGLQAHKHGCANKIARPAQWDARLPCAGCQAESALQGR